MTRNRNSKATSYLDKLDDYKIPVNSFNFEGRKSIHSNVFHYVAPAKFNLINFKLSNFRSHKSCKPLLPLQVWYYMASTNIVNYFE